MSDEKKIDGRTCVRTRVHGQDCYLLPVVPPYDKRTEYHPKRYKVYTKVRDENNRRIGSVVEREYPITPESVKSFRDTADYRIDPASAVAASRPRTNLGDVRGIQDVSKLDDTQLSAMAERFAQAQKELLEYRARRQKEQQPVVESTEGGENNG